MQLAEALAERNRLADLIKDRGARARNSARYQEGTPPAETAMDLITEARGAIAGLDTLRRHINHTNTVTEIAPGFTITDAISKRDALGAEHKLLTSLADAAGGRSELFAYRRTRSTELRELTDIDVPALRTEIDQIAAARRALDVRIQQANWGTALVEGD